MNGRQRNATNGHKWGKKNDANYGGNCTLRHFRSGTYEISGRLISVEHNEKINIVIVNIVRVIKSKIIRWAGHVARIWEEERCIQDFCGET